MITWHVSKSSTSRIWYHLSREVGNFDWRGNANRHSNIGGDVARQVHYLLRQNMCHLFSLNYLTPFFFHKHHNTMNHHCTWSVFLFFQVHILCQRRPSILHPHANVEVEPNVKTDANICTTIDGNIDTDVDPDPIVNDDVNVRYLSNIPWDWGTS